MKLIFVRHAEPDYANDSLTEKGFKEAELLKDYLKTVKVDEFYCSPLGRAKRTSEPTLKLLGKKAKILPFLEEFPGRTVDPVNGNVNIPWDYMPSFWTSFPESYDKDKWFDMPILKTGNVKETYEKIIKDFDVFLAEHGYQRNGNCYDAVKPNTDTILFFCHFGIECVLLGHLIGISPTVLWHGFVGLPTSITTVKTEEREEGTAFFRCRCFGELPHLIMAGETPSEAAAFRETFNGREWKFYD
ncbi:MAG: histidine phosphatase family protein [Clostridia bacterium]|nr:histidine phosphatase family protein [Clostridia bacterium]